jgi:seryl-tRNA synthetase
MLDIKFIRLHPNGVKSMMVKHGLDPTVIDVFLSLDSKCRALCTELKDKRHKKNVIAKYKDVLIKLEKGLEELLNAAINLGALATAEYTESYACGEDTALSNLVEAGNSAQTFERGVFHITKIIESMKDTNDKRC